MTDQAELMPCPFCGSAAVRFAANMIVCSDMTSCGAQMQWGDKPDKDKAKRTQAIVERAWNTRPYSDSGEGMREALRKIALQLGRFPGAPTAALTAIEQIVRNIPEAHP